MSSLIMGRQRRGKIETSTLVDPATMTGAEQIFPLGYKLVLGPSATTLSCYGSTLSGSFPQFNTTPLKDLGPTEWVYVQNNSAQWETIATEIPDPKPFEAGSAVCSLYVSAAQADGNTHHVTAANLLKAGPFICDILRTEQPGGGGLSTFSSSSILGFAQGKIEAGHYGFIQTKGPGAVLYHAADGTEEQGYTIVGWNDLLAGTESGLIIAMQAAPAGIARTDEPLGCGRLMETPTAFGAGNPTLAYIRTLG